MMRRISRLQEHRAAEIAKYMENAFLAMKVAFCYEFAAISEAFGR
jgi:UDP-glucose 6-dehydrogenase